MGKGDRTQTGVTEDGWTEISERASVGGVNGASWRRMGGRMYGNGRSIRLSDGGKNDTAPPFGNRKSHARL